MRRALAVLALVARDKRRGSTARSAGPAALGSSPPPRLEEGVMRSLAPNPFAETSANGRYLRANRTSTGNGETSPSGRIDPFVRTPGNCGFLP
jgi:hypothetical protein